MLRCLFLGELYGLSDPALEAAISDCLSFRRFAGFSLDDEVPDHSTLWHFRDSLRLAGLEQGVFQEVNRQLDEVGLIMRKGTILDATIIEAQASRPKVALTKFPTRTATPRSAPRPVMSILMPGSPKKVAKPGLVIRAMWAWMKALALFVRRLLHRLTAMIPNRLMNVSSVMKVLFMLTKLVTNMPGGRLLKRPALHKASSQGSCFGPTSTIQNCLPARSCSTSWYHRRAQALKDYLAI